jgi:hypothetical protein
MKYIDKNQILTYLNIGKCLEQWLSPLEMDGYEIIRFIEIEKNKSDVYILRYIQVFNEGSLDFLDINEFSSIDPDRGYEQIEFEDFNMMIKYIIDNFSCSIDRFQNRGMCQDDYEKYLISKLK